MSVRFGEGPRTPGQDVIRNTTEFSDEIGQIQLFLLPIEYNSRMWGDIEILGMNNISENDWMGHFMVDFLR